MKIIYGTLLLLALLSGKAFTADSVNIGVTGNIVASPCIFNGGSNSLDVNLGNIQATNMATPGSTSDPVPFSLLFTQCPTGTKSVTVSFTGSPDPRRARTIYEQRFGHARGDSHARCPNGYA